MKKINLNKKNYDFKSSIDLVSRCCFEEWIGESARKKIIRKNTEIKVKKRKPWRCLKLRFVYLKIISCGSSYRGRVFSCSLFLSKALPRKTRKNDLRKHLPYILNYVTSSYWIWIIYSYPQNLIELY